MVLKTKSAGIPQNIVRGVVIRTLRSKIEEINQKLNNLFENMRYFEKKYGMKTEEFYKQFVSGKLGDDMDFFEWKASAEIYNELKEEKKVLIEAI